MPCIILKFDNNIKKILLSFTPKTGGTSLIKFFKSIGGEIYLHNENNKIIGLLKCPSQHFHYKILEEIYNIEKFDFSFCIMRNPIEKLKSDYLWSYRNTKDINKVLKFDNWYNKMIGGYTKNNFFFDNHIRPQHEFFGPKLSKIYKMEHGLEYITKDVFKNINLTINYKGENSFIPRENSSENFQLKIQKKDIKISAETINSIQNIYKEDFEIWESIS